MLDEMQILKELEYTRTWGSKEELKAAKYIQTTLKKIGIESTLEKFKLNNSELEKVSLEVTKPYKKKYACNFYKLAGNAINLVKDVVFVKDINELRKYDVENKIVLLQGRIRYWKYKELIEAGCKGIVLGDGHLFAEDNDIDTRELREKLQELGKLPIVSCNIKDLYEMASKGVSQIKMTTVQKTFVGSSQNVVAHIKGRSKRHVVLTAHYDSTALSKGSWDNTSGSVGLLKLADHFSKNKPLHNMTFIWCGAEERGLCGSKAYVKKHKKELDKYDLCINLDMIGATIGKFLACVTGEEKMVGYIDYLSSIKGKACHCYQDVYSSDSTPFADNGIPAVSFGQGNPATPIHCRFDTMFLMNKDSFNDDYQFIEEFVSNMVNAKKIPIERTIPDNMKERLDIYLFRKRGK